MNDVRIKSLQEQKYSEVDDQQMERNQERVEHASSILSELEKRVESPTERLEMAKELLSVAGSEVYTEGCNIVLSDCLKLLRESAEDAGLAEYYRKQIQEMPDKAVSGFQQQAERHLGRESIEEKRRRAYLSECEGGGDTDGNQGDPV